MSAKLILKRRSKYRNVRARVDGITFDSKREAARWLVLKAMEKAGEIIYLARQVKYLLAVNGVKITTYVADFKYWRSTDAVVGPAVVEDVKGVRTEVYRLKKLLMKAIYRIEIKET